MSRLRAALALLMALLLCLLADVRDPYIDGGGDR